MGRCLRIGTVHQPGQRRNVSNARGAAGNEEKRNAKAHRNCGGADSPCGRRRRQAETTSTTEHREHEFACTATTVGGAVAGVALGSLLGGGLGKTLFETAGGVMGGMAGHALKCPGK